MRARRFRQYVQVRFVRPDDPGFVAYVRDRVRAGRRPGARVEPLASYHLSRVLEEAARRALGEWFPLWEERVLAFEARAGRIRYRELDAVAGGDGGPLRLFEVKSTRRAKVAARAHEQVAASARMARSAFGPVARTVVWVDTGLGSPELHRPLFARFRVHEDLADLAHAAFAPGQADLVRLDGEKLWRRALDWGLTSDPGLWERTRAEARAQTAAQAGGRPTLSDAGGTP